MNRNGSIHGRAKHLLDLTPFLLGKNVPKNKCENCGSQLVSQGQRPPVCPRCGERSVKQPPVIQPPIVAPPVGPGPVAPPKITPSADESTVSPPPVDAAFTKKSEGDVKSGERHRRRKRDKEKKESTAEVDELLPPRAPSREGTPPAASPPPPPPSAKPESEDILLPPKAKEKDTAAGQRGDSSAGGAEHLLPGKSAPGPRRDLLPGSHKAAADQDLLPPVAYKRVAPHDPSGTPSADAQPGGEAAPAIGDDEISESDKVLLPDGKGGFIEVSERTTTVEYRGAKIELSRMKREEKEAVRSITNFVVVTFCVLLLVLLMLFLSWYSGLD